MSENTRKSYVSAQQVADLAGVSRSAVSRTFTDGASVSKSTRTKVLTAAETLGYHVNHLARGLIRERSNIVCLIAADINTPYQSRFIETLTRRLQAADKVAMLINTTGDTGVEPALRQTLHYRADASIVLSGQPAVSLIDTCLHNGQRVIVVNRDDDIEGPQSVSVSNTGAARNALHMLKRAGCKRMAIVSSRVGTASLVARETAFAEAAREEGLPVDAVHIGATSYASGAEAARQLLSRPERPDGAFCVTDLLACGFMDVARHEFGLRIPEELCVVGFDDIEQAGWSAYELTTFRQPIDDITSHIIALVTQGPEEPPAPPASFEAQPVWRRSVRPR